jgi:hypothetical protein
VVENWLRDRPHTPIKLQNILRRPRPLPTRAWHDVQPIFLRHRPSQRLGAGRAVAGRKDECNRNLAAKRRRRSRPHRVKEIPRAGAIEEVPIDEALHEFKSMFSGLLV